MGQMRLLDQTFNQGQYRTIKVDTSAAGQTFSDENGKEIRAGYRTKVSTAGDTAHDVINIPVR